MLRQSESDEQRQQNWQARSAKQRVELSLSIEEALADATLMEDLFSDAVDEAIHVSKNSVIIPPRLSLQSRPMPAVYIEPVDVTNDTPLSYTDPVKVPQPAQNKRRLAGRTTKVHLQAVPKSEKKLDSNLSSEAEKNVLSPDEEAQNKVKGKSKRNSTSMIDVLAKRTVKGKEQQALAGSGILKQGQREVMVMNTHISPSSVVVVTLVEDPGPVVVKHISLLPQTGFTLHFSDSAAAEARFNYVVLMGELF